jgi:hypothetical protein
MTDQPAVPPRIAAEARKIYLALFGADAPPAVVARFAVASDLMHCGVSDAEVEAYYAAIDRCDDLEALELAARYTGRLPLLGRKFRLMAYLAETLPDNQAFFVNSQGGGFVGAFVRLAGAGFRTAGKMAAGLWLVRGLPRG